MITQKDHLKKRHPFQDVSCGHGGHLLQPLVVEYARTHDLCSASLNGTGCEPEIK